MASTASTPTKIFVIACLGTALPNLDLFSVNIALPAIAQQFSHASLQDLSWVLNAYAITYAALLVFLGRLSEGYRRDRSFMLGIGIFAVASAASAAASQVWALVAFRAVAAAGAALMTPTSISLLLASFAPERRGTMVRHWAAAGGLAAAMGPLLGGLLASIGWRWIFIMNATVATVALLVAWRTLPAVPGHAMRRPSVVAATLLTAGIAALIFTIVKGHAWGWQSAATIISATTAVALLAAFAAHCRYSSNPLMDRALLHIRPFMGALLAIFPYSVSFGAMLFSVALWGQSAWGWSALHAGLAMIAGPLMVPVTSTWMTGRLVQRFGPFCAVACGTAFVVTAFGLWVMFISLQPNTVLMVVGMAMNGTGVGLIFPTLMGAGTQALPPSAFATGSGIINMLRQTAIAVGVAIFVVIIGTPASQAQRLEAFMLGWCIMPFVTLLTLIPAFLLLRKP